MSEQFILSRDGFSEFRAKGSVFYGRGFILEDHAGIKRYQQKLHEKFSDATHICYAYRLAVNERVDEFTTDAGEPGGSAGRPILSVLRRENLINSIIFVIRYFGGTKLGIPGLIEAYGTAAAKAVEKVPKRLWVPSVVYTLTYRYDQQPLVKSVIREFYGEILHQSFGEFVVAHIRIDYKNEAEFIARIRDKSSGTLQPKKII